MDEQNNVAATLVPVVDADTEGEIGLAAGVRFGGYEIVRPLGEGAFGAVYEALRLPLKKRVAIKVLHRQHAQRREVVDRFVREAEVVAQLEHPHIVPVFDVGVHDGLPFLAMEFLEGETLASLLQRGGRLAPAEAVDLMLAVMSAVAAVHDKGVIHRDLKPDNLYLSRIATGGTQPKLLDFGIAKVIEAEQTLTRTNAMLGTPVYMSPEQAEESKHIDAASDQWSLGVILYECVTGARPFVGKSLLQLLNSITVSEPADPRTLEPSVPTGLAAGILRALSKKPSRRWPTVRAFGAAILPYATPSARARWGAFFASDEAASLPRETLPAQEPAAPPPVAPLVETLTPATRPSKVPRPRNRRLMFGVALAVLAATTGAWLSLRDRPAPLASAAIHPTRAASTQALAVRPSPPPLVVPPPSAPPPVAVPVAAALVEPVVASSLRPRARRPAPPRTRPMARAPAPAVAPRVVCPNGICPVD